MTPALPRTRADFCGGATIAPRASVICRTFSKLLAKFPDGAQGQGLAIAAPVGKRRAANGVGGPVISKPARPGLRCSGRIAANPAM